MNKTRDQLLDELLDRQAITDLVHTYARAADRHDHELMRSLYHPDAIDEHGHFFTGPAMDFIDRLPEIQKDMLTLHHNITSVILRLDGDRAEGEVYLLAMHQAQTPGGVIDVLIGGRYFDRYEKRAGAWKFAHRAVVADWAYVAEPSAIRMDHPFLAGALVGRPGPSDPSYAFFERLGRGQRG